MGSGQFLWLLSCLLQESNKKKDGCSVHGILQWVCLVQNVSFVGAEPSQAPKFLSPVPPTSWLLPCLGEDSSNEKMFLFEVHRQTWNFCKFCECLQNI